MPKPKKPGTVRFPFVFATGNREHAEVVAEEEHGGNITAYLNNLILVDRRMRDPAFKFQTIRTISRRIRASGDILNDTAKTYLDYKASAKRKAKRSKKS